jgi:hypothetical protein
MKKKKKVDEQKTYERNYPRRTTMGFQAFKMKVNLKLS